MRGPASGSPSALRRLSAAASLLALALAVLVIVAVFLHRLLVLPLVALGLVVAVFTAWTSLVSSGRRRVVHSAIAVVALAVTLVLLRLETLIGIALVVVLVVAAQAAARVALGEERELLGAPPTGHRVGPSDNGVLLMNPRSGGGKVEKYRLVEEARRRGVQPIVLAPGDDLRGLAERAVADGARVIGVAGGDGSQALVADVARSNDVAFVCVPAGTRNHFAIDLGLDRSDVAGALDAFGEAVERRVDLATVAGHVFVNNASLGVYATIVQSDDYRDAKLDTAAALLPALIGPKAPHFDLRYDGPDGRPRYNVDLLLVSNNPYELRSLAGLGTRPRLDTGVLGIVTVHVQRATDVSALVALEAAGAVKRFRGLREWTAPRFRIDSSGPVLVGLDGEAMEMQPPLEFLALPAALRVRLPLTSRGARQTVIGQPGVRRTIRALFRVLANRPASPDRDPRDEDPPSA